MVSIATKHAQFMVQTKVTASLRSHILQAHLFRNSVEQLITHWEAAEKNVELGDYSLASSLPN